jgi:hypothetical protein
MTCLALSADDASPGAAKVGAVSNNAVIEKKTAPRRMIAHPEIPAETNTTRQISTAARAIVTAPEWRGRSAAFAPVLRETQCHRAMAFAQLRLVSARI